ncbi:hypothetical protein [Amycolatopsis kentuckyensis]|uniref:beta-sandwich lipoprotein n=1 Tax=Amycolatopsis kentuckyensis TaxID=218823 RepID=UPI000A362A1B|nr:hypothetical protein [Amycolatopsis kentuckyensis]
MKRIIPLAIGGIAAAVVLSGCTSAADQANENLSKAAENFEVPRRIVGVNGITDKVLFSVEGFCSIENDGRKLDVICKVSQDGAIERTTLGLSDNVTYVSTQLGGKKVDLFRPRIIFRPETIVPNFELSTSN